MLKFSKKYIFIYLAIAPYSSTIYKQISTAFIQGYKTHKPHTQISQ